MATLEQAKGKPLEDWTKEELINAIRLMERHADVCGEDLTKYIRLYGNLLKVCAANNISDFGVDLNSPWDSK